ncbi:MAG: hypothetical protein MUC88_15000 [Planctomycetes bacterium]|nr:hypothetical protein [Planctomycetota bacterium]
MAVRTVFRWATGPLIVAAFVACVQGQQLYVGSGTVVHSRVYGPYAQPVYPHPGPGLHVASPFPAVPVYVPAFGPYLYGPVIVPPAYPYWPNRYQAPVYPAPIQPNQGYQPQACPSPGPPPSQARDRAVLRRRRQSRRANHPPLRNLQSGPIRWTSRSRRSSPRTDEASTPRPGRKGDILLFHPTRFRG